MSLSHAILGLLTVMPMTGYDLKNQAFDSTVAHFWQADQAQIYRTLAAMAEAGWVESRLEIQEERPNRKVYHITEAGRAELLRWMQTEQPLPVHREAFLIQLFFGSLLSSDTLLKQIEHQREGHKERLARYTNIPMPALDDPALNRDRVFWRLTIELGIALEQTYLRWLDLCAQTVEKLEEMTARDTG